MIYDWQYEEAKKLGIKPCQCGGATVIHDIGNSHTKTHCVEMVCSKCHIKRKQCILNGSRSGLTFEKLKEGVIKDWNTRPIEDELLTALKECFGAIKQYHEYEHDGDPWTEDARAMGEMDLDYFKSDGRMEKISTLIEKLDVQEVKNANR